MQTIKPALRAIGAIFPIIYWGYLAIHFFNIGGSVEGVQEIGLGPTVLGTGIVSLLFAIPLLLQIPRLFSGRRASGSRYSDHDDDDDTGGFDADAAIARYMAQRGTEPSPDPSPRPPTSKGPANRTSFGRRS